MNKNAIIFGAGGQDGYYLTRLLRELGVDVIGVVRRDPRNNQKAGDVSDQSFVERLISAKRPDYIFQFAAISSIDEKYFDENYKAIVEGTLCILRAVRSSAPHCRVFIPGSALQFSNNGETLNEKSERVSKDHYSLARNLSLEISRYHREKGLRVYFGYLFHHDSPRRNQNHVAQKVATFAREFKVGQKKRLEIRDPKYRKEWTFAGDVVSAIWTLVNNDTVFEAAIGSGELHSISEWIDLCFDYVGIDRAEYLVCEPNVPDTMPYCADPAMLRQLGWKPNVGFVDFADMMMK